MKKCNPNKRLYGVLAASAFFFAGCAHSPDSTAGVPEMDPVLLSAEDNFILELADMGGTGVTRLHSENIILTLDDRERHPEIAEAFDRAFASRSEADKQALIRQIELRFVHDPGASALDLLGPELSEHFRTFDWQYADYPGGEEGPNEQFADVMVDALDIVRPERRANRSRTAVVLRGEATEEVWEYLLSEWQPIPDTDGRKLNRHAIPSFVAMREAAAADGVDLVILSAHRDPKRAAENAARAGNPYAVASFSAHSLGLAIDFDLDNRGAEYPDLSTRPMKNVVLMRESPVHKWLHLYGDEYGWYPFQHEPWHWEYNPPGFRPVFWQDFQGELPDRVLADQ